MSKRRKWTDNQKFKVVMDLLTKDPGETKAQIYREHDVHPTQARTWKKKFLQRAPHVFSNPKLNSKDNPYKKIEKLENIIGQQTIELKVLKKTLNYSG